MCVCAYPCAEQSSDRCPPVHSIRLFVKLCLWLFVLTVFDGCPILPWFSGPAQ